MTEKESALYSHYIIDGVRFDATPADLLDECSKYPHAVGHEDFVDIVDESTDSPVTTFVYESSRNAGYVEACLEAAGQERPFSMLYPDSFTRLKIAEALLDRLWNDGHYRLGDLDIWAKWDWNTRPLGNMASFYMSSEAAGAYIFDLGVKLHDYVFMETDGESNAGFYAWLPERDEREDDDEHEEIHFKSSPFESTHPWISDERRCADTIVEHEDTRIVYIPFDTCRFSIGGSLLAQVHGRNGGVGPHIQDPDYFIDCYEVVRELVEDGIVMAGRTVADGGLAVAAARLCGEYGLNMDINGLLSSYQENDSTKMLFGEVPGVVMQISENDMDYLDSQLILQDVAYYPLGNPSADFSGIRLRNERKADVSGILASLLVQASEGED